MCRRFDPAPDHFLKPFPATTCASAAKASTVSRLQHAAHCSQQTTSLGGRDVCSLRTSACSHGEISPERTTTGDQTATCGSTEGLRVVARLPEGCTPQARKARMPLSAENRVGAVSTSCRCTRNSLRQTLVDPENSSVRVVQQLLTGQSWIPPCVFGEASWEFASMPHWGSMRRQGHFAAAP